MDSLPEELTTHIFQYLPATDIARFEHLNRYHGSIISRNRTFFKNPNISVIYSENGMKEMEFKVVSSDIGSHWKNGKILRILKITIQHHIRIVVVQGGEGELPEGGENVEETISIIFQRVKENIAAAYARWGRYDVPDIPEFALDTTATEGFRYGMVFNVILKEKPTIGVLRFVDCDLRKANNFIRDSRSTVGRLLIERNIFLPSFGIVHAAQNSNDCRIYARIDLVWSLIADLSHDWHTMYRYGTHRPWTTKVFFKKENSDRLLFGKIREIIRSANDSSDFQAILSRDEERGLEVVTIRGINVR